MPSGIGGADAGGLRERLGMLRDLVEGGGNTDDERFIHYTRVTSRRLRVALKAGAHFLPKKSVKRWRSAVRELASAFGEVRDLDVHMAYLRKLAEDVDDPVLRSGLDDLVATLAEMRSPAQETADASLARFREIGTLGEIASEIPPPAEEASATGTSHRKAGRLILKRLDRMMSFPGTGDESPFPREAHRMRIAAKKLRYTLELFAPELGGPVEETLPLMKRIQDILGLVQDGEVWRERLPGYVKRARARLQEAEVERERRLGIAAAHIEKELRAQRKRLEEDFVRLWRESAEEGVWDALRFYVKEVSARRPEPERTSGPEEWEAHRRAVLALAESCGYEEGHTHQVLRLALRLFDGLASLHGMGETERFWLECASTIHDVGWLEGQKNHNKRAFQRVMSSDLLTFGETERRIIGCVARYHRGAHPKKSHAEFAPLAPALQETVRRLAAILRVADSLDRTHTNVVDDIECEIAQDELRVLCSVRGPAEDEILTAHRKGRLLEEVFGRRLVVQCSHP